MKKIFTKLSLFLLFILGITMVGCSPKGDPTETLTKYYQNIKDGNIEGAYETLSQESKKNFSKENFVKWLNTKKELSSLKETKVEKVNEYKDKDLDGIKFKNVTEFNVTEKFQTFYENKEETINYKRNVVNDNGTWKVYRGKENGKEVVAIALNDLAWMYIEGKGGKSKDLNQAATILNEALQYSQTNAGVYYSLARVYTELERYDEAIGLTNKCIEKSSDNVQKSNAYNILGVIYESKSQFSKAKEYYTEAIKLNSNNQYAKTNLERVKQY